MSGCKDINDTVPLDSLMRYVLPSIPALPSSLGVDLLRDAYREMMARSEMLSTIISLDVQQDVVDYELVPPDGYSIHRIREIGYKGNWQDYRPAVNYWYTYYDVRFKVIGNTTIILRDCPTADSLDAFQIRAVVVPDECAQRIPREVSTVYGAAIAKGALAQAYDYAGRPWFNPNLGMKKQREFENGIRMAKNTQLENRGAANTDMRGRRWV